MPFSFAIELVIIDFICIYTASIILFCNWFLLFSISFHSQKCEINILGNRIASKWSGYKVYRGMNYAKSFAEQNFNNFVFYRKVGQVCQVVKHVKDDGDCLIFGHWVWQLKVHKTERNHEKLCRGSCRQCSRAGRRKLFQTMGNTINPAK